LGFKKGWGLWERVGGGLGGGGVESAVVFGISELKVTGRNRAWAQECCSVGLDWGWGGGVGVLAK